MFKGKTIRNFPYHTKDGVRFFHVEQEYPGEPTKAMLECPVLQITRCDSKAKVIVDDPEPVSDKPRRRVRRRAAGD